MSICHVAEELVRSNLNRILELRSKKTLKDDNSYVSQADIFIQTIIINYIKGLSENYHIISEELSNDSFYYDPSQNYVVMDPLDGTENFVSGLKEWGFGLSVYKSNVHFESMILLPELDEVLMSGSNIKCFESRIYGISSSLKKKDLEKLPQGFEYRILGCSMYNMFNAIRGSFATFENVKGVNCWDVLPGLNLALERGVDAYVDEQRYHGEFLPPNRKYRIKLQHR